MHSATVHVTDYSFRFQFSGKLIKNRQLLHADSSQMMGRRIGCELHGTWDVRRPPFLVCIRGSFAFQSYGFPYGCRNDV